MYPAVTFSDAPFTAPAGSTYIAQVGVLTATRAVTLPLANTVPNGTVVIVKDESGTATATNTVTVARQGADTINGGATALVIDGTVGAYVRLVSNGATAWTGSASLPTVPKTVATVAPVKTGTATLVAGTVTVADTAITANSVIRVTSKTLGGTPGALFISAKTAATSFVISSTNAGETSVVQYDVVSY
jgi:hypothetical protein